MFVVSLNVKKRKRYFIIVAALGLIFTVSAVCMRFCATCEKTGTEPKFDTEVQSDADCLRFISDYGWETDKEPTEVRDVVIPAEFDDVYENYNQIQLSQGFDLREYAGRRVQRRTYIVNNYPNSDGDDSIRINILICDGSVIGGDVCSIKLDGFMHGFERTENETGKT